MAVLNVSKPIHRILADVTGESRLEVALPLALKDLLRLKLREAEEQLYAFEKKYGMDFQAFKVAWNDDQIPDKHSYPVESDYWVWEAAVTDSHRLGEILETLP